MHNFFVKSASLSGESIREAVCLQDQEGNNIFHIIFEAAQYPKQVIQTFEEFMQLAGCKVNDEIFVQALCMQNSMQCTPLRLALGVRITDKMLC